MNSAADPDPFETTKFLWILDSFLPSVPIHKFLSDHNQSSKYPYFVNRKVVVGFLIDIPYLDSFFKTYRNFLNRKSSNNIHCCAEPEFFTNVPYASVSRISNILQVLGELNYRFWG